MKWVKHITSTWDDEKIARLVKSGGVEGLAAYGLWWRVLEVVAGQMDSKTSNCSVTYDISRWSLLLSLRGSHVRHWLEKLAVTTLLTVEWSGTEATVTIPNLLKYRDEYSKRSGVCAEQDRDIATHTDTDGDKNTQVPAKQVAALVHEIQLVDPLEDEIRAVSARIHIRHPQMRRCSYSVVEKKIRTILKSHKARHGMDKEALLATIDRNHKSLCDSSDWTESDGKYAKSLEGWLNPTEDRYMVFFDQAKARDSPKQPTQLSFGERKRAEAITMQEMMRGTYDPTRSM